MAVQDEQFGAPQTKTAPAAKAATPAAPARDPYAMGPTNYESFDRAYNSNAAAAKAGASNLESKVSGEAQAAQGALASAYGGFQGQVQSGTYGRDAQQTGQYGGPDGWQADSALQSQYGKAAADAHALGGSTGDIQALTGPRATSFGASLTRKAGGQAFQNESQHYAGLRGELGAASQNAQTAATQAKVTAAAQERDNPGHVRPPSDAQAAATYNQSHPGDQGDMTMAYNDPSTGHYDKNGNWQDAGSVHGHYNAQGGFVPDDGS